jgi:hypothetical protein
MNVRDIIKHLKSIDSDSRYSVEAETIQGVLIIHVIDTTIIPTQAQIQKEIAVEDEKAKAKAKKGGK